MDVSHRYYNYSVILEDKSLSSKSNKTDEMPLEEHFEVDVKVYLQQF